MIALACYATLVVGVNWAFAVVPMVALPNGDVWTPVSLVVGFIYIVRDFVQIRTGHHVLWAMLAGCIASWYLASPELAIASAAAFAVGEAFDWALFSFTRRPFSQRILLSSLVGVPLDSFVFLGLVGMATPVTFAAMTASKLVGAMLVFLVVRRREAAPVPVARPAVLRGAR
ncbi:MAG: VUT family protein [Desulfovibrio sp.]|jgi:uncharacterized PurR-regulated membrane protein YhhQ (DUF165 family)|nr:VUT family protein [Desulfovibrio sp.]